LKCSCAAIHFSSSFSLKISFLQQKILGYPHFPPSLGSFGGGGIISHFGALSKTDKIPKNEGKFSGGNAICAIPVVARVGGVARGGGRRGVARGGGVSPLGLARGGESGGQRGGSRGWEGGAGGAGVAHEGVAPRGGGGALSIDMDGCQIRQNYFLNIPPEKRDTPGRAGSGLGSSLDFHKETPFIWVSPP